MGKLLSLILGLITSVVFYIGSTIIFFWTVWLGYVKFGILGGVACFFLPFLSQIFMLFRMTADTGGFLNSYNLTIIVVIICKIVSRVIQLFWTIDEKKEEQ